MKILVAVKRVIDYAVKIRVKADKVSPCKTSKCRQEPHVISYKGGCENQSELHRVVELGDGSKVRKQLAAMS